MSRCLPCKLIWPSLTFASRSSPIVLLSSAAFHQYHFPAQDVQDAAGRTTFGQTLQSLTSGNPLEALGKQTQSTADSAAKAAPSPSGGGNDALQGAKQALSKATLSNGNPLPTLQSKASAAVSSATKGLSSSQPAIGSPGDGISIGEQLKDAFTTSPPQIESKGSGGLSDGQSPGMAA